MGEASVGGVGWMKILELIGFIRGLVPGTYYPNMFPVDSEYVPDNCSVVKLTGGFPTNQWTGKKQPSFQIRVRGETREQTEVENRAYEIHNSLTNLREIKIGDSSIVVIRAMNSFPLHIGDDENKRPIYSMNFDCVVRPK